MEGSLLQKVKEVFPPFSRSIKTSVFHDIAYQYTQIVQYNTDVQTTRFIRDAYKEQHLPDADTGLPPQWQSISIKGLNFSH